jgi:hypothetical protein
MKLTTLAISVMAAFAVAIPTPNADADHKLELVERATKNPKCVACNTAMEACARKCYVMATAAIVPCYLDCQNVLIGCRNAVKPRVNSLPLVSIELMLIRWSVPLNTFYA